jgi:hypothetical protein
MQAKLGRVEYALGDYYSHDTLKGINLVHIIDCKRGILMIAWESRYKVTV